MRGHGASENAAHGYRVYRLSKDLRDVMEALDLRARVGLVTDAVGGLLAMLASRDAPS